MQAFSNNKKIQTFGKSRNASKSALLFEYMRECNFLGCIGFIVALRFTPKQYNTTKPNHTITKKIQY